MSVPSTPPLSRLPPSKRRDASSRQPHHSLPQAVSIHPVTPSTLPGFRRLIVSLLPIRYSDKFYKGSVSDPLESDSLTLCAQWQEPGQAADSVTVVGGVQGRLEPLSAAVLRPKADPLRGQSTQIPSTTKTTSPSTSTQCNSSLAAGKTLSADTDTNNRGVQDESHAEQYALYIQTLCTSPAYRRWSIGSRLLEEFMQRAIATVWRDKAIVVVYAHVWEANEDALAWYAGRGFETDKTCAPLLPGYYSKLRPSGARVVSRRVGVHDRLEGFGQGIQV